MAETANTRDAELEWAWPRDRAIEIATEHTADNGFTTRVVPLRDGGIPAMFAIQIVDQDGELVGLLSRVKSIQEEPA